MLGRDLMLAPLNAAARAANESVLRSMGQHFRADNARLSLADWLVGLAVLATTLGLWWALTRLLASHEHRRRYNCPHQLFRSLCKAHGLERGDERLLRQLAVAHQLDPPGRLFLEPQWFETERLSSTDELDRERVAALRARLFDAPVVETSGTPPVQAAASASQT